MAPKSPQNREKDRLRSLLGNHLEKGSQNDEKKEPPEDEKSNIFDEGLFEITLSANCNNVEKTDPRKHEFGEVFGDKIGFRSKKFHFKSDTKNQLTFDNVFERFLCDLEVQDGAKMAPRQRQDEATMASRCCFKSSII